MSASDRYRGGPWTPSQHDQRIGNPSSAAHASEPEQSNQTSFPVRGPGHRRSQFPPPPQQQIPYRLRDQYSHQPSPELLFHLAPTSDNQASHPAEAEPRRQLTGDPPVNFPALSPDQESEGYSLSQPSRLSKTPSPAYQEDLVVDHPLSPWAQITSTPKSRRLASKQTSKGTPPFRNDSDTLLNFEAGRLPKLQRERKFSRKLSKASEAVKGFAEKAPALISNGLAQLRGKFGKKQSPPAAGRKYYPAADCGYVPVKHPGGLFIAEPLTYERGYPTVTQHRFGNRPPQEQQASQRILSPIEPSRPSFEPDTPPQASVGFANLVPFPQNQQASQRILPPVEPSRPSFEPDTPPQASVGFATSVPFPQGFRPVQTWIRDPSQGRLGFEANDFKEDEGENDPNEFNEDVFFGSQEAKHADEAETDKWELADEDTKGYHRHTRQSFSFQRSNPSASPNRLQPLTGLRAARGNPEAFQNLRRYPDWISAFEADDQAPRGTPKIKSHATTYYNLFGRSPNAEDLSPVTAVSPSRRQRPAELQRRERAIVSGRTPRALSRPLRRKKAFVGRAPVASAETFGDVHNSPIADSENRLSRYDSRRGRAQRTRNYREADRHSASYSAALQRQAVTRLVGSVRRRGRAEESHEAERPTVIADHPEASGDNFGGEGPAPPIPRKSSKRRGVQYPRQRYIPRAEQELASFLEVTAEYSDSEYSESGLSPLERHPELCPRPLEIRKNSAGLLAGGRKPRPLPIPPTKTSPKPGDPFLGPTL